MLAGDERLGLRRGAGVRPDESMDTIFVKHIREQGPAWVAGLSTGDRIISVNGETVAGKSYAHVVQLIQQTLCNLYLLVVPMENDILQLVSAYIITVYCTKRTRFSNIIIIISHSKLQMIIVKPLSTRSSQYVYYIFLFFYQLLDHKTLKIVSKNRMFYYLL